MADLVLMKRYLVIVSADPEEREGLTRVFRELLPEDFKIFTEEDHAIDWEGVLIQGGTLPGRDYDG